MLFGFEGSKDLEGPGGDSEVETPEHIPNSEVKHFSGENSWACPCEHSTLPDPFFLFIQIVSCTFKCKKLSIFFRFFAHCCITML